MGFDVDFSDVKHHAIHIWSEYLFEYAGYVVIVLYLIFIALYKMCCCCCNKNEDINDQNYKEMTNALEMKELLINQNEGSEPATVDPYQPTYQPSYQPSYRPNNNNDNNNNNNNNNNKGNNENNDAVDKFEKIYQDKKILDAFVLSTFKCAMEISDLINSIIWVVYFKEITGYDIFSIVWYFEISIFGVNTLFVIFSLINFVYFKCKKATMIPIHILLMMDIAKYMFGGIKTLGKVYYTYDTLSEPGTFWLLVLFLSKNLLDLQWLFIDKLKSFYMVYYDKEYTKGCCAAIKRTIGELLIKLAILAVLFISTNVNMYGIYVLGKWMIIMLGISMFIGPLMIYIGVQQQCYILSYFVYNAISVAGTINGLAGITHDLRDTGLISEYAISSWILYGIAALIPLLLLCCLLCCPVKTALKEMFPDWSDSDINGSRCGGLVGMICAFFCLYPILLIPFFIVYNDISWVDLSWKIIFNVWLWILLLSIFCCLFVLPLKWITNEDTTNCCKAFIVWFILLLCNIGAIIGVMYFSCELSQLYVSIFVISIGVVSLCSLCCCFTDNEYTCEKSCLCHISWLMLAFLMIIFTSIVIGTLILLYGINTVNNDDIYWLDCLQYTFFTIDGIVSLF